MDDSKICEVEPEKIKKMIVEEDRYFENRKQKQVQQFNSKLNLLKDIIFSIVKTTDDVEQDFQIKLCERTTETFAEYFHEFVMDNIDFFTNNEEAVVYAPKKQQLSRIYNNHVILTPVSEQTKNDLQNIKKISKNLPIEDYGFIQNYINNHERAWHVDDQNEVFEIIITGDEEKEMVAGNIILGKNNISMGIMFPKHSIFPTLKEAAVAAGKIGSRKVKKTLARKKKIVKKQPTKKAVKRL